MVEIHCHRLPQASITRHRSPHARERQSSLPRQEMAPIKNFMVIWEGSNSKISPQACFDAPERGVCVHNSSPNTRWVEYGI